MTAPADVDTTAPGRPRGATLGLAPGDTVAGMTIVKLIGEGGMARVYRARDPSLARDVALKILVAAPDDDEARARFLREAHALARVDHENVVRVWSSGVDGDRAWMSLALVEGEALDEVLADGPLDVDTALLLAAEIARGLAAVHREGVVHRDVKPANLLVDAYGRLRIADFGVAAFLGEDGSGFKTRDGVAVGTPHFMSPEQARGLPVDGRADAWALGATLFAMIAGRPPFFTGEDDPDLEILARVLRDRAPDVRALVPTVPAAVAQYLSRLLEPDRAQRPSDLDEIADTLQSLAAAVAPASDVDAEAASPPAPSSTTPPLSTADAPGASDGAASGRAGPLVPVVALALVVVGVGLVASIALRPDPPPLVEPPVDVVTPPIAPPGPARDPDLRIGPPPTPPPPTPDELAARELAALLAVVDDAAVGAPARDKALRALLARDDEGARTALRTRARSASAGPALLDAIARENARAHLDVVIAALADDDPPIAVAAARALGALRAIEAIPPLDAAARDHPDASVRRAALAARRSIFSVEDTP